MDVHIEQFAAQVNYLAAIGRRVVPRAFSFAGRRILFGGHAPSNAEELASLLPDKAEETSGLSEEELDLRARSSFNEFGYSTNVHPSACWRILTTVAVPELGLSKVAGMIAWFCRCRKQQRVGRQTYVRAIGEWEHDLDRLKRELYPS